MSNISIADMVPNLKNSALTLFVGDVLGSGSSRHVFEMVGHEDRVLKVEYTGYTFHNQTEWNIWHEVKHWPISDWFAKCHAIDGYGNVMVQARTVPFQYEHEFRDALRKTRGGLLPTVFSDTHHGNFGMLDGQVVCHDYGYHRFLSKAARQMCEEVGYLHVDDSPSEVNTHRQPQEDQFAFNL